MTTATDSAINQFEVGAPAVHAALTLFPLFPCNPPTLEYIGLDEAIARGAHAAELNEAGNVENLAFDNPLDELVFLYEGEALVGAKQNRIVQRAALLGPKTATQLPVHCVEQGRWGYRSRLFDAVPRAATPAVRKAKGNQSAVWASVAHSNARLSVVSLTAADEDAFVAYGESIDEFVIALPRASGQCGVIAAISGSIVCLDYVGRSDVFAGLYRKLLRGYALDSLGRPDRRPAKPATVRRFLSGLADARQTLSPAVGIGSETRLSGAAHGIELSAHAELIALSAFPT
jgi:hypothetical protein